MSELVFIATTRAGIKGLESAKRLGHRVTLVTSPKDQFVHTPEDNAAIARFTDEIVPCADTQDPDSVQGALEEILRKHPIDGVVTTFELFGTATAVAANRLGLRSTNAQGVIDSRDKGRCREIMAAHGIPSVRFRVVHDVEEACAALAEIGYPAIVKPVTASGKAMTFIAHDEAEVRERFSLHQAEFDGMNVALRSQVKPVFVIEEMAHGPLYSIELAIDEPGNYSPLAIVRRQIATHNPIVEMGSSVPSGLSDEQYDEIADYAIRVVKALDLRLGIFHVEFILTDKGPILVEVNPRIGGGPLPQLVEDATGVDMFELLARVHTGQPTGYHKLPFKTASGHIFIGALDPVTVREDLPEDWFEEFRPRIVSGYVDIRPGQKLPGMRGNFDIQGVLGVLADSYEEVIRKTNELRDDVERVLGFKLIESAG